MGYIEFMHSLKSVAPTWQTYTRKAKKSKQQVVTKFEFTDR